MLFYSAVLNDLPLTAVRSISQLELFVNSWGPMSDQMCTDVLHTSGLRLRLSAKPQQRPDLCRSDKKMRQRLKVLTRKLIVLCVSDSKGNT